MKKILILGGIFLHKKLVEAAHDFGYKTIVVDNIQNSPAKLISDQSYDINVSEVDEIVELCRKENVCGVITGYIDFCQRYYQQICEKLNFPCYGTFEQFQILTNKEKFKAFCVQNDLDVIPSYTENDFTENSNTKVEYPVYIKPSYSRGSRGQFVCNTKEEVIIAIKKASDISNDGKAIIEKYLANNDNFQVTYFVVNGIPYLLRTADQYQGDKKIGLEKLCLAAVSPSKYTDMYINKVHPRVVNAIRKLGIKNGPVFMQGFIDNNTVRFYDPGLRFPGTDYSIVLKNHLKIDTAKALVEFAVTGKCDSLKDKLDDNTVYLNDGHIINLFPTCTSGTISFMSSEKELLKIHGVENVTFRHSLGCEIEETGDVNQRIAEINIWGDNKPEIEKTITDIYKELKVLDNKGNNLINNKFNVKHICIEQVKKENTIDYTNTVKILTQKDLIDSGCMDFKSAIEVIEQAFIDYSQGKTLFPDKVSVIFDEQTQDRINCLPAAMLNDKVYGVKWVSVFPQNPHKYNKPNLSAVSILSELETGFPIAFMSTTMCSNIRTACVGAVAAKYLARKDSKTIGFIGAGEQAKSHFLAMKTLFPNLNVCKVSSRTIESERNFIAQMENFFPDMEYVACYSDYKSSIIDSDIIVTAISGQEKILQADWIKQGAFYCHVAGLEDDFNVAYKANKIVCDRWETVKHRTQTISQMYQKGLLKDKDIYADLYEIITGSKKGRESNSEFIYFNSVGLSFLDTALAFWMYKKAEAAGKGIDVILTDKSMFV